MTQVKKLEFQPENEGDGHLIAALQVKGDPAAWLAMVRKLLPFPRVMFCLYASCAAPLLHICEAPNFIIDLAGDTSRGKTTALEIASSAWGLPAGHQGGLVKSWNVTKVFAERYSALFNDLPVFLDDSQTADARTVAGVLYMVANGIGRGRGAAKGGVQRVTHWRTICFSTGEQPLTSNTEFGGARARVLTLWGSPFGDAPQGELVREVKSVLARHYGHGAYQVVNELIRLRRAGEWDQLRELYLARVQALATRFPGNVADRLSRYVALVWVAGDLVHSVLDLPGEPEAAVMSVMREVAGELEEGDYATRAMDAVRAWAQAREHQFYGKEDFSRVPNEYIGVWRDFSEGEAGQVAFFQPALKKFLTEQGFSFEAVIRQWRDRAWIKTQSGKSTIVVKIKGNANRMVVIPLTAWLPKESEGVTEV
jgi:putative DNA primase/helicase